MTVFYFLFWTDIMTENLRLAASYLIKNEVDIIEANIRFHAQQGVDHFAIMDNGSTDGTREVIESLRSEFDIFVLDRPEHTYQFHKWRQEIVGVCDKAFSPDITICCDADEFWINKHGKTLKSALSRNDSVVTVPRYNMIPSKSILDGGDFYDTELKVLNPISFNKEAQKNKHELAILLSKIGPKVAVNPRGLISLNGGNHRAKHIHFWNGRVSDDLAVYHYPVRSYEHFERNVLNRKKVIDDKSLNIRIGDHYRRWARIYDAGRLHDEYMKFFFSVEEAEILKRVGVLEVDEAAKDALSCIQVK